MDSKPSKLDVIKHLRKISKELRTAANHAAATKQADKSGNVAIKHTKPAMPKKPRNGGYKPHQVLRRLIAEEAGGLQGQRTPRRRKIRHKHAPPPPPVSAKYHKHEPPPRGHKRSPFVPYAGLSAIPVEQKQKAEIPDILTSTLIGMFDAHTAYAVCRVVNKITHKIPIVAPEVDRWQRHAVYLRDSESVVAAEMRIIKSIGRFVRKHWELPCSSNAAK